VAYIQQISTGFYNPTFETYAFRQHVVDADVKVYVLNSSFKIRPYLIAGGGYARSTLNYDQRILDVMRQFGMQGMAQDYNVDAFLANVGAGAELQLGKNVSIGAQFKYHAVLTARENAPLNGAAFGGFGMMPGYPAFNPAFAPFGMVDPSRNMAGGSLARTGFFTVQGNVNISF
jgi:hypothetical protein